MLFQNIDCQAIKNMIWKSWSLHDQKIIGDARLNLLTISFESYARVEEIILNSLWNILGNLFNIKAWPPELSLKRD